MRNGIRSAPVVKRIFESQISFGRQLGKPHPDTAAIIRALFDECGWHAPVALDIGNGFNRLGRIELPTTAGRCSRYTRRWRSRSTSTAPDIDLPFGSRRDHERRTGGTELGSPGAQSTSLQSDQPPFALS